MKSESKRNWYSLTPMKEDIKTQSQKSPPFGTPKEFDIEEVMGYSPKSPQYSKWYELIQLPESGSKFDLSKLEQMLREQQSSPPKRGLTKVNLPQVFPTSLSNRKWFENINLSPPVSRKLFSKPERVKKA
jgi:hypothetical protein